MIETWTVTTAGLRLLLSMVYGFALGLEREHRNKPAGVRTITLISVGSCLLMLLSIHTASLNPEGPVSDPGRIAAQVVTGIGFLGAGTIIRSRVSISGLTTAALIWVVAGIGLAVGAGMYWESLIATAMTFAILTILRYVEPFWGRRSGVRNLHFSIVSRPGLEKEVRGIFLDEGLEIHSLEIEQEGDKRTFTIAYQASPEESQSIRERVLHLQGVEKFEQI
jgi:putative Mg2+ transporter-C (MgtC) family protein